MIIAFVLKFKVFHGDEKMQHLTNQQKLKPWMGFVLFAVVMIVFRFAGAPLQDMWGLPGLVATELEFLVLAIVYALVFRIPVKEMFPIRKFSARDFFGSVCLGFGGVLFGLISVALVGIIYPKSLEGGDVQAIQSYIGGGAGYLIMIFAMAILPAVCEEAIHRGAIIANFRAIKKDWVIVLIMGLFFGIFHLSTLRFINTAIMGACLTYIVVKKNNLILSMITHFLINFVSSTMSFLSTFSMKQSGALPEDAPAVQMTAATMKAALGLYLWIGIAAPFLIVIGLMLLNPESHKKIRFLFAGITAAVMFAGGMAVNISNTNGRQVAQSNFSYQVMAENTESLPVTFNVEEEGNYTVSVVAVNAKGEYFIRIEKDDGEFISRVDFSQGAIPTSSQQLDLEPGSYNIFIINGNGSIGEHPTFSVQVNRS